MVKSKLITLIKTLNESELARLDDYLASPFFNKNQTLLHLFHLIKATYPHFEATSLDKKRVLQQLFPQSSKKSTTYLNKLMTQLSELVLDFMSLLKQEENAAYQQTLRLKTLQQRGLHTLFVQEAKKQEKEWGKMEVINVNDYYNRFIFMDEKRLFYHQQNNRKETISISEVSQQLHIFYVVRQLQYYVEVLNRQQIVATSSPTIAVEDILLLVKQEALASIPLVQLYVLIIRLLQKKEANLDVQQLQQFLVEHAMVLHQSDLTYAYTLLLNYYGTQYKQTSKVVFLREIFQLYKAMLKTNLFLIRGTFAQQHQMYFHPHHFKNIATTALRLQEFDWAIEFTHTYKKQLAKEYQEGLTHFNLGAIAFYQKDYHTALQHFLQIDYPDFFYHLNAEMLMMKTYYALEEWEALSSKLDAFRTYIKRSKHMAASDKDSYRHFVNFVKRLIRLKTQAKRIPLVSNLEAKVLKATQKLQQDVEACQPLIDKEWLLAVVAKDRQ